MYLIEFILVFALLFWLLHLFYIAVMALRDRRDDGTLSTLDKLLGYPTLFVGLLIDFLVNTLFTFVLLELPHWHRGELLLTPRLRRLAALPANLNLLDRYRRKICRWLLSQIDQHDKSGGHNLPD